MEVNSSELIEILRSKITLYEHLGITVLEINADKVVFAVSLEKNKNHKGTAFGGSLYATAVLAAYALVLAGLKELQISTENIVIAKGSIEYFRPVETDFEVHCSFSSAEKKQNFYQDLQKQGRVRGVVKSQIVGPGGSLKAVLLGDFVVKL